MIVLDSYDFHLPIKVIVLTALEYLREDMAEETNKNSCEAKKTPDPGSKNNNQGTSTIEMPDLTTTISHMPEDTVLIEVMTAWQEEQKIENGNLAKLKVFGEETSQE